MKAIITACEENPLDGCKDTLVDTEKLGKPRMKTAAEIKSFIESKLKSSIEGFENTHDKILEIYYEQLALKYQEILYFIEGDTNENG